MSPGDHQDPPSVVQPRLHLLLHPCLLSEGPPPDRVSTLSSVPHTTADSKVQDRPTREYWFMWSRWVAQVRNHIFMLGLQNNSV